MSHSDGANDAIELFVSADAKTPPRSFTVVSAHVEETPNKTRRRAILHVLAPEKTLGGVEAAVFGTPHFDDPRHSVEDAALMALGVSPRHVRKIANTPEHVTTSIIHKLLDVIEDRLRRLRPTGDSIAFWQHALRVAALILLLRRVSRSDNPSYTPEKLLEFMHYYDEQLLDIVYGTERTRGYYDYHEMPVDKENRWQGIERGPFDVRRLIPERDLRHFENRYVPDYTPERVIEVFVRSAGLGTRKLGNALDSDSSDDEANEMPSSRHSPLRSVSSPSIERVIRHMDTLSLSPSTP